MTHYTLQSYGDDALLVEFHEDQSAALTGYVRSLRARGLFSDVIPAYRSIAVQFDPSQSSERDVRAAIQAAMDNPVPITPGAIIEVPVHYGGGDLKAAGTSLDLSRSALIQAHSAPVYDVAFLGFLPGFTFLSGLPGALSLPRHDTPRMRVLPGSVGIAGGQTGLYALPSPGGWQILGRTPWKLFSPDARQPFRFKAGDRLKFMPITRAEFDATSEHET